VSALRTEEYFAERAECGADDGVEWGVIERVPCSIKLLKAPKNEASFHDFEEFERIVEVARSEALALLVVLLGGEGGCDAAGQGDLGHNRLRSVKSPRSAPPFSLATTASVAAHALPRISGSDRFHRKPA